MMWYMLSVKRENACYPKTLDTLNFENYGVDNGYTFESEYFCDVEEKADCLVEMGIEFRFDVLPDYGNVSRLVYDKDGYLKYKKMMNEV